MTKESVHIVDSLHKQFLDEVWADERQRGLSKRQRQLLAQLISVSASLQEDGASSINALDKLKQSGLDELLDSFRADNVNAKLLAGKVLAHMAGLIHYWQEPHFEKCGLPMFEQAIKQWLNQQV